MFFFPKQHFFFGGRRGSFNFNLPISRHLPNKEFCPLFSVFKMLAHKIQNFFGIGQKLAAFAKSIQSAGFSQGFPGTFVEIFGMGAD